MKRYINLIITIILFLGLMVLLFYFLLRSDGSYVTYVKLQVNPSFVIGINEKKNVVFYNSLNTDGNKFNLSMFEGKSLDTATKVFISKLGNASTDKDEINLTVMTKNNTLKEEIVGIMKKAINDYDKNYNIISHEASHEELERYSNEVIYNINASMDNDKLVEIGEDIHSKVDEYIQKQINNLKLNKLSNEDKNNLLKEKEENNYFNEYNILSNSDDYSIIEGSNYQVHFDYNDDGYTYDIVLNLVIETKIIDKKTIVEDYSYTYEKEDELGKITSLKTYFYTF